MKMPDIIYDIIGWIIFLGLLFLWGWLTRDWGDASYIGHKF